VGRREGEGKEGRRGSMYVGSGGRGVKKETARSVARIEYVRRIVLVFRVTQRTPIF